ncbi:MAG: DUF4129 domain-containing protein [Cytophagales bacterium]|nr:DUF4129 domain-containing protein [Bernardetiaceae bacterium]MDW8205693.1 DUF4129 domain-containing protein [Cytophagales bacterium]
MKKKPTNGTNIPGVFCIVVVVLLVLLQTIGWGQSNDAWNQLHDVQSQNIDQSKIKRLTFDSAAISKYLSDDAFLYDSPKTNFFKLILNRFKHWFISLLEDLLGVNTQESWLENVFYGLATVIMIFVVAQLIKRQSWLFIQKARAISDEPLIGNENIHNIEFEQQIANAEAREDFRCAVRLHYLHLLKQLADCGLIKWQPQKTNMQYVAELSATPLSVYFTNLTRDFAYVWYGQFKINAALYHTFKQRKQALYNLAVSLQTAQT